MVPKLGKRLFPLNKLEERDAQDMLAQRDSTAVLAKDIMSKKVQTVYKHQNVSHAVDTMVENNIGSVVVLDNQGPCGVFAERDLLSKVLVRGKDPGSTIIMEVLSPSLPSVDPTASAYATALAMVKKKSRLMVFEGGDLVGIITPTDLVRLISKLDRTFSIDHVVSKSIVRVAPEMPLDLVVREMDAKRVGSVIVSDDGRPMGIFTERDLLKRVLAPRLRLDASVGQVMSSPVVSREYGIRSKEAAEVMIAHRMKRLPLFKRDTLRGVVTARDLVEAFADSFE